MPSRVDNLQRRKAKAVSKGKDKKAAKLTKKINKSMARQEERGMRRAEKGAYGGRVKTSGMRKKAKKALGRAAAQGAAAAVTGGAATRVGKVNPKTGVMKLPNTKRL